MTLKISGCLPEGYRMNIAGRGATAGTECIDIGLIVMQSWGYQLVVPPLVEYLGFLITGTSKKPGSANL